MEAEKVKSKNLKLGDRIEATNAFGSVVQGVVTGITTHVTIDMTHVVLLDSDDEVTVLETGVEVRGVALATDALALPTLPPPEPGTPPPPPLDPTMLAAGHVVPVADYSTDPGNPAAAIVEEPKKKAPKRSKKQSED